MPLIVKPEKDNTSYSQIIKSTTIFGGSQAFVILIGIVRTKIIALILGPAGIGIIGIFQSVIDMLRSGYSMGMDTAGVREIAETNNKEDKQTLEKTIARFNRWFLIAGLLALFTCIIFCYPISLWAFEDSKYALPIAGLSLAVFIALVTTGRTTILQGLRRIPQMAKSTMWGSLFGLLFSIPVYLIFGVDGIVPAFIGSGLIAFLSVEHYYRKQHIQKVSITNKEAFTAGLSTFKLGIYIVMAGLVGTVSMFLIKTFISRNMDIDAAGYFQAAWAITTVYIGLILHAMGSDFFPRLSAIADDAGKVKKLVNEQSYIVLVIATPVIISMIVFSDFVLSILYSSTFTAAESLLRWQMPGAFFKVLSWPVAFILLAKNKGLIFFLAESAYYVVYLLASYLLYPAYGLDAAGIAYLIAYIVYLPIVLYAGYRISGFEWDNRIPRMLSVNLIMICVAFYVVQFNIDRHLFIGTMIFCLSIAYAYYMLNKVFSWKDIKDWFDKK